MRISDWSSDVCSSDLTKTVLTRAIIEQAVDATNPRWMVARGGVANPRELIDKRRGGVVNVRSLTDSVAPLPSQSINQLVPQVIAMVDRDRKSVVQGKSVSVRVVLGGRRSTKKNTK